MQMLENLQEQPRPQDSPGQKEVLGGRERATVTTSDETQVDPGQEAPHSAQGLRLAQLVPLSPSLGKVQIKWEALNQVATGL